MNLTILKLEEAAKSERETVNAIEWDIIEAQNTGVLSWETEEEYNKRIQLLTESLNLYQENVNRIEDLIQIIKNTKAF